MNESPTILRLFAIWNYFWSDLYVECDLHWILRPIRADLGCREHQKIISTPNAGLGPYSEHDLLFE